MGKTETISPLDTWRTPRIECAHGAAVTVWHYTLARDLPACPHLGERIADGSALYSGSSPGTTGEWLHSMTRLGHAITECRCHVPTNHVIIGAGVGHDDARFAESGESMAAYYESGEAFGGAWWEAGASGRRYYVPGTDGPPEHLAAIAGECSHGGHGWDGETCSDIPSLECERCGRMVHSLSADGQCIECIAG